MSETKDVRIVGGTVFIGLMVFIAALQACQIRRDVGAIRERVEQAIPANAGGGQ